MILNNDLLYKLLKYAAIGSAFYLILKFVPNQKLETIDILIITFIIVLVCLSVELLLSGASTISSSLSVDAQNIMCSSVCSRKENFNDIVEHNENVKNLSTQVPAAPPVDNILKIDMTQLSDQQKKMLRDTLNTDQKPEQVVNVPNALVPVDCKQNPERCVPREGSRSVDGVITNEMQYNSFNNIPLPDNYNTGSFEYGYSFLPPEKWYPQPPFPPVCVSEKTCPVCPVSTTGMPVDVKEWNETRRVTGPDNINVKYVTEKLNSGK